jgi:hypothetical protein
LEGDEDVIDNVFDGGDGALFKDVAMTFRAVNLGGVWNAPVDSVTKEATTKLN